VPDNQSAIEAIEQCFLHRGDNRSLDRFNREFEMMIKAWLATISGGDPELVQDSYQDAFAKYIRLFRSGKKPGKEYRPVYFVIIAKNCLIDARRKQKKSVSLDSIFPGPEFPNLAGVRPGSEGEKMAILLGIMKLAPRDRVIIEKHYIEEMDNDNLASLLGVQPVSVPMLVKRSREKLKKILL
jgi:RNA polymerase sigma factor (sigma-70 family)